MYDNEPIELKITNDKLVDILLHAATRDDMAKNSAEIKAEVKAEFAELRAENVQLRQDMRSEFAELRAENVQLRQDMLKAIESFEARIDRQFLKIDNRYNWIIGIIVASALTMCGMIARGFHWY